MLERWLVGPWKPQGTEEDGGENSHSDERLHSILWRRGGAVTIPFGTYQLLRALTYGYLQRKPPAAERWLKMLEAHLNRDESTRTWTMLSRYLTQLRLCPHERAVAFLQRLFEKYPGARDTPFGADLLTHVWSFLPANVMQQFLQAIRDGRWKDGPQAYGELLALRAFLYPEDHWAKEEVRRALKPRRSMEEQFAFIRWGRALLSLLGFSPSSRAIFASAMQKLQRVRVGLAFTAAHLWQDSRYREEATEVLIRLIPLADAQLSRAVMHVFLVTKVLYVDDPTRHLLQTLIAHPGVFSATEANFLVERLEDILAAEPELAYNFCRELVLILGDERATVRTALDASTSHLTNIALTLQRFGGDYRTKGLDLFETLLDLGVHDAQATLQELDKRPRNVARRGNRLRNNPK